MPAKNKENDEVHSPLPTYLSPPTKSKCPSCNIELYLFPVTTINDVKTSVQYTCASCKHCFSPVESIRTDESVSEKMSNLSVSVTLYDILGVERIATPEDIARAYRKKSLQCHPDRTKGREKEWEELAKAYEILGDKRKRHWYDVELENGTVNIDASDDPAAQGMHAR